MSNIRFLDQTAVSSFDAASGKIDILQTGSLVLSDAGSINFEGAAVQVVTSGSNGVTVNISSTASSADAITTASAVENRITFTKGDSSTFVITVDTGSGGSSIDTGSFFTSASISGSTLSFTQGNGNTLDVILVSASYALTASHVDNAVYTGSVSSNILTFTKGDGSTFDLTVDTGSGTNIDTSSFATTGSNTFTGSQFFTGSLIPEATSGENGIWDLGSVEKPWRDLYITTSSLNFVKDGEVVSILNGGPDFIQVGNIRISTGSLEIVNNDGDVVSTIAEAEYSGSEPVSGSILETGSLLVTGSVSSNVLTFTKGDGSTFDLTVDTGSGGGGSIDTGSFYISSSVNLNTITFTQGDGTTESVTVDTGSGATDTGSLLTTASAANNDITFTKGDGSTFVVTVDTGSGGGGSTDTGSLLTTASVSDATITFTKGDSTTFEITVDNVNTASFLQAFSVFDGNRIVSNTNFPSGIYNNNFGTSGSLTDFIEKVFFPNTSPTLTSVTFSIEEFEPSASVVGVVTASDAEGQTITFGTQSSYTNDFFRIHSGSGTITANALVTTSMNDDTTQGYSSSLFPITLTDTFGGVTNDNVYIRVLPNAAPVWREGGVGGNIITQVTTSLSESSAAGSKAQYYFTDEEGDTITIETGSLTSEFSDAFRLEISSSFVRLVQTTASLDYETYTSYSFVLTASDEHYPSPDPDSIAYLPVLVPVVDNLGPTVGDQTITGVTESSAGGTSAGSISATDPENNTILFTNFTLISMSLDGVNIPLGTYGGTSQSDPTEDAFETDINGNVTRIDQSEIYINSDIINEYVYRVTVSDAYNTNTDTGDITIPIVDDQAPSINGIQTFYIIETAESGSAVYDDTSGRTGTTTQFTSNQSVTFTANPSSTFNVNANGNLFVNTDISGAFDAGDTINGSITASNSFGTTTQQTFTVNVTTNFPATGSFTDQSGDWNTNEATTGTNLVSVTITDPESDTPYSMSLSGADASSLTAVAQNANSSSYQIQAASDLAANTYNYTATVFDEYFFSQSYDRTITIAQAAVGTMSTNGTLYVIESAVSGDDIVINPNGFSGTQGDLSVSYSPNYGSQVVQSFTSSNAAIAVNSNGELTLGLNLSGSTTGSGDTISSDITFRDQYDNIGSGSITVNVTINQAPTATLNLGATSLLTSSLAVSGSVIASLTGSDPQSLDNITSASLSGTDAGEFVLHATNGAATTRRYEVQASSSLASGTYSITGSVFDAFGKSGSANLDIVIAEYPAVPDVFIYSSTRGDNFNLPSQYNLALGSETTAGSPVYEWASGSLGTKGPVTLTAGVMTLIGSASSGLNYNSLSHIVSASIGSVNPSENEAGNHLIYIVYPSSSDLPGRPDSMTDAFGGNTAGEYVLYYFSDAIDKGIVGSQIDDFTISTGYTSSDGTISTDYTDWTVLGCNNSKFSSNSTTFYVVPSSGSAPA